MLEQRREQLDESLDKLDKLIERWEQRLTLDNLALAERYLKGELRIHVHLLWASEEFCAIFEREQPVSRSNCKRGWGNTRRVEIERRIDTETLSGILPSESANVDYEIAVCAPDSNQEFVLVRDVELMKPPKRVVPSVVWLGSLDKVHHCIRRSLYLYGRTGFKSIGISDVILEHGEAGVGLDLFPTGANQFANQEVKGGPEIVDSVANDGTPPERGLGRNLDLIKAVNSLRLIVGNDFIGFALPESFNQRFEITDVLFGPFDLYPNASEVGLASHATEG